MLAQYAQVMGIKAAQQEMQGNDELRAVYAQGGDLNDPAFRQRVMAANPKLGSELIKRNAETGKLQNEAVAKRIELSREMLTGVDTPEAYLAWHESNHKDPILGGYLSQRGVTAEQSRAKIIADLSKPGGLEKLKRESALGAGKLQQELMQTERTRISAGPGYQQAALAQRQYEDKLKYGGDIVNTTIPDPENRGQRIEIQARRDLRTGQLIPLEVAPMPLRVDISPSSATSTYQPSGGGGGTPNINALAPQTAPALNVNALNANAPQTQAPAGPTFAMPKSTTAPTVTEVDDPATPGQKLRVDARVYQQGTTLGAPGVFGVARTENLTPAQKQKLKGEISKDYEAVQRVVGQTNELLESIDAVRSSNLERVAGPIDARTFTLSGEGKLAETRFENLKGKVTAIAKANASLGGAIGSIANQEWQILANQIAVLELKAGKEPNLEQIERLEREALSIVNRMRDGFQRQYGTDVETLAPQYKDVPNVNYTPGQYTKTGKVKSGVDNNNPLLK
jgi:hypothetical protein